MGDTTGIAWSGATWNSWQGCRKKSEGCRFCYMFRDKLRYGQDPTHIHRSSDATFNKPLKWQREVEQGKRDGEGRLIFACSWSDWFIKDADPWRDDAWAIIRRCPDLIFQILTKRPERMADHLPMFWDEIHDRCWLGASAEDQKNYDIRRPYIDSNLSPVMWWSLEPMLGPIDLKLAEYAHKPAWAVVGGESGANARPFELGWARDLMTQCRIGGIAYFHKQMGSNPWTGARKLGINSKMTVSSSIVLRDSHGSDMSEWDEEFRVREFPPPSDEGRPMKEVAFEEIWKARPGTIFCQIPPPGSDKCFGEAGCLVKGNSYSNDAGLPHVFMARSAIHEPYSPPDGWDHEIRSDRGKLRFAVYERADLDRLAAAVAGAISEPPGDISCS